MLDNFICASSEMEMEEKLLKARACVRDRLEHNPMEPLLIKLAREFTDNQDLSDRLLKLYKGCRAVWGSSEVVEEGWRKRQDLGAGGRDCRRGQGVSHRLDRSCCKQLVID